MTQSKTIVLVHGNFVNDTSWTEWKRFYEQRGYVVHALANPGHEGKPEDLRENVHPDLVQTGFIDVVTRIADFIDALPEKPLVIGHSMAGMVALKLVEMGKVAAGVSINGAPPKNVFPPFQTLKTVLPAFGFFSRTKYFLGSRAWYNYAFFNTIPAAERESAYLKIAVPESFKVSRELVFHSFSAINFDAPHVPILCIGGGRDHIFPASLTERIARRYTDAQSSVAVKIFEDRSHFTCGEKGWETVAEYILTWYEGL